MHIRLLLVISLAQQDDQEDISPGLAEQQWDKKLPEPLSWRSDEEDEDSDFGEEQRDCYLKVSQSKEHQQFITFLQRLLGPLLEAYSSAAIFIHNFSGPVPEPEYLQKLHKYLLTRTERNIAVYGTRVTSLASFESYDFLDYWDLLIIENWGGGIAKLF